MPENLSILIFIIRENLWPKELTLTMISTNRHRKIRIKPRIFWRYLDPVLFGGNKYSNYKIDSR